MGWISGGYLYKKDEMDTVELGHVADKIVERERERFCMYMCYN